MAESARGGGQPLGTAVRPDRGGLEQRAALDHERARPHLPSGAAHRQLGLAGQVGLIERKPLRRRQGPVGDHLVTGRQAHQVAGHHLVDRHAAIGSVPDHNRVWSDERREAVECSLRSDLLEGPDRDVRDQDPEKQGIPPRCEHDREHAEDQQDPVGNRQRIGADDAAVGAARASARSLPTRVEASRSLDLGQPGRCGLSGDRDRPTLSPADANPKAGAGEPSSPKSRQHEPSLCGFTAGSATRPGYRRRSAVFPDAAPRARGASRGRQPRKTHCRAAPTPRLAARGRPSRLVRRRARWRRASTTAGSGSSTGQRAPTKRPAPR